MSCSLLENNSSCLVESWPDGCLLATKSALATGTARRGEEFTERVGCFWCQQEARDFCTWVQHAGVINSGCCVCLSSSVPLPKPEIKTQKETISAELVALL